MIEPIGNVTILDEPKRIPSPEEVREYAEFLGIDPQKEPELLWIAREGVVAAVPPPWKACTENGDDIFYFNFETAESVWDHPCDAKYRQMVEEHRDLGHLLEKRTASINGAASCALTRQRDTAPRPLTTLGAAGDRSRQEVVEGGDASSTAALDRQARLALIRREISDEESDADAAAAGVLDVEVTFPEGILHDQEAAMQLLRQRSQKDPQVVDALLRLSEQHKEGGAAVERKEVLERALSIHERLGASGGTGVLERLLQGLAETHGALGDSEAQDQLLDRLALVRSGEQLGYSSPDRGLAGVGLAPVGMAREPHGDSEEEAASASSSSSEGSARRRKKGPMRTQGYVTGISRPTPPLDNPLELSGQSGVSGRNSSALSEISEDLALELDNSLSSSQLGLGGRATDTLELSNSALDASSETAVLDAAAEAWARQTLSSTGTNPCVERLVGATALPSTAPTSSPGEAGVWLRLQGEVKALSRALIMLKDIREQQKEYLSVLETVL